MLIRRMITALAAAALAALPVTAATAAPARPVSPEADFLIAVHQGNLAQITAGRLAARKGDEKSVRKLGKRFAAYHRKLDAQVRAAAEELEVKLPGEPNSEQLTLNEQYRAASGPAFDSLFVTTQISAYERAAKLATIVLRSTSDPTVRKIVVTAAPVIEKNRDALTAARNRIASKQPRQ
ncbi:DUF4142 domain-containing protein [Actinoplanes sp. NPDC049802]|uniref:DUF4142 domain-containing protein n=1 Tax=Actinoplanes sp. NPDC049802 TaxID=3154742 RepID=UPI0033E573F4